MRKHTDGNNYYLLHDDGSIHYPFSKYVTDHLSNPNTRDIASKALRIFYRFCNANQIEIALRAIEFRCLTYDECIKLKALCFRPITETENSSDRKVRHINSAKAGSYASVAWTRTSLIPFVLLTRYRKSSSVCMLSTRVHDLTAEWPFKAVSKYLGIV